MRISALAASEVNQAIVTLFRERKIEIPFPQREIRLLNSSASINGSQIDVKMRCP